MARPTPRRRYMERRQSAIVENEVPMFLLEELPILAVQTKAAQVLVLAHIRAEFRP
jgi:hypothetical protein